ncbi:hypothetical protein M422DRAFT_253128 [Sphaerobolus stellatus SS14]|uniref:Uncharacterized protein n=1 Tax=Sphaerobolus stellatus (strain SS14) TaxID=990650 RepID=A0A0C9VXF9_SPHS4|nr:hypothetical protein M422DRAFT_253128 [Sphaerobolus stellatus SS14]
MLTGSSVATAIEISSGDEDPADTCIKGKRLEKKSEYSPSRYQTPSSQADPRRFADGKGKERASNKLKEIVLIAN